jgi:hypothetical protein
MKIDSFSFGEIGIGSKTYGSDILIVDGKVVSPWVREDGHYLSINDLKEIMKYDFDVLVIGKGTDGFMEVDPEVIDKLKEKGIKYYVEESENAVITYNDLVDKKKNVVLAIHLTC